MLLLSLIFQGIFGVYQGASNHEELHNLMKATVMIRRLKKDVLSELPVKRRQQVVFLLTFSPCLLSAVQPVAGLFAYEEYYIL
jgi:SNF2 family DNA or RNA helicase